jgi:hypothetical protein
MRDKKILIIAAIAVMLVVEATALYAATTYWSGTATTPLGTGTWQGTLDDVTGAVAGTWAVSSLTGTFDATATYNSGTRCWDVTRGDWQSNPPAVISGYWAGCFCPRRDTAYGVWWTADSTYYGTWAGNQD